MCLNPIRIANPNRGMHGKVTLKNGTKLNFDSTLSFLRDTTSAFIEIPCGHCPQCIALRQSYKVQRTQCEEFGNDLYFCTLTYSPKMIPTLTTSEGRKLNYPDIRDVQCMMKRLRKDNALGFPFKYVCCSEYGSEKHRPHFHIIFSLPKQAGETLSDKLSRASILHDIVLSYWQRNIATTTKYFKKTGETKVVPDSRNPVYVPLCNYVCNAKGRNFDFHYVDPSSSEGGSADVAFYVTKYTCKCDDWYEKLEYALYKSLPYEEFKEIKAKIRPHCMQSHNWGDPDNPAVKEHIRKGIDLGTHTTEYNYSIFINPVTGQTFPLSPYFRRKFETIDDVLTRYYQQDPNKMLTNYDNMLEQDHESFEQAMRKYERADRMYERIAGRYLDSSGLDLDV